MEKGLIQIYTGGGKGKTTAAVGQAIRAKGRGYRTIMVYWLKEQDSSGEMKILKKLGVETFFWGSEYGKNLLTHTPVKNIEKINISSGRFLEKIKNQVKKENCDLLIMDEVNVAVDHNLLEEEQLINFLKNKPPSLEVILTGRRASQRIMAIAHLITEMRKVKHPYNCGIKIRKGIEY